MKKLRSVTFYLLSKKTSLTLIITLNRGLARTFQEEGINTYFKKNGWPTKKCRASKLIYGKKGWKLVKKNIFRNTFDWFEPPCVQMKRFYFQSHCFKRQPYTKTAIFRYIQTLYYFMSLILHRIHMFLLSSTAWKVSVSVFFRISTEYGPEKLQLWAIFTQCKLSPCSFV